MAINVQMNLLSDDGNYQELYPISSKYELKVYTGSYVGTGTNNVEIDNIKLSSIISMTLINSTYASNSIPGNTFPMYTKSITGGSSSNPCYTVKWTELNFATLIGNNNGIGLREIYVNDSSFGELTIKAYYNSVSISQLNFNIFNMNSNTIYYYILGYIVNYT